MKAPSLEPKSLSALFHLPFNTEAQISPFWALAACGQDRDVDGVTEAEFPAPRLRAPTQLVFAQMMFPTRTGGN